MQVTPWIVVDVFVAMLIAPLSVYAWERYLRRDRQQELLAFGVLTLGILAWELNSILIDVATTVDGKLLWYNVGNAVVAPILLYSFLWFAVAYSRFKPVNTKWIGVVAGVHVAVFGTVFAFFPEFMYEAVGLLQRGPTTLYGITFAEWIVLDRALGLSFNLYQLYIYAMTVVGGAVLARYLLRNRTEVSTQQAFAIAIGVGSPLLANALVFTGVVPPELNTTDIAFGLTGIAFAVATFRYRLFRLVPMGREQLVETMNDPVVMLNEEGRVVDCNAAARDLSGIPGNWRNKTVEEFLAPFSDLLDRLHQDDPVETEIEITTDGTDRFFDLDISTIDSEGRRKGQLLVLREITQRKVRERELETQRNNLDVLNTMMRHDIRNDLQLVTAYLQTIEEYVEDDAQDYVDRARNAANEAVVITRDARDVTEVLLNAGSETTPIPLRSVLENEVEEIRAAYEEGQITIAEPIEAVEVQADDMLESVFRNLLKNAIEHNDTESPKVVVSTEMTPERVRVVIADNGPGIPPERQESIFDEGEKGLDSEGTGLGLYLVGTLVDRYDGDVWIKDNEPRGAIFVVELKRAK